MSSHRSSRSDRGAGAADSGHEDDRWQHLQQHRRCLAGCIQLLSRPHDVASRVGTLRDLENNPVAINVVRIGRDSC